MLKNASYLSGGVNNGDKEVLTTLNGNNQKMMNFIKNIENTLQKEVRKSRNFI